MTENLVPIASDGDVTPPFDRAEFEAKLDALHELTADGKWLVYVARSQERETLLHRLNETNLVAEMIDPRRSPLVATLARETFVRREKTRYLLVGRGQVTGWRAPAATRVAFWDPLREPDATQLILRVPDETVQFKLLFAAPTLDTDPTPKENPAS